ncbi:hypothetical protein [Ruthenibacterium lactatiformans]|uniref:hypothetical protein n=1 Tax=Ruthenibacterium lactatiformans TaxID=1550024 RepID=UPI001065D579|nr:hypothetical protein [Ruthenibacterium lactatiformans]
MAEYCPPSYPKGFGTRKTPEGVSDDSLGYRIDENQHYQIDPAAPLVLKHLNVMRTENVRKIVESFNARGRHFARRSVSNSQAFEKTGVTGKYRYKDTESDAIQALSLRSFRKVQDAVNKTKAQPYENRCQYMLTTKLFWKMRRDDGRWKSHTGALITMEPAMGARYG